MSANAISLFGLAAMLILMLGGMWIPFAVGFGGILMLVVFDGIRSLDAMGFVIWGSMNASTLSAIPMFVLMAEILLRSGISGRFYDGLATMIWRLPGGLLQSNIVGSAMFAAISGSSVATAASIGGVALPQQREKGYDMPTATASVAVGGTLGILIPPSIAMIIYASFAEVSVARLFTAGILPGLLLTAMFMAYIALRTKLVKGVAPVMTGPAHVRDYFIALLEILPVVGLIGCVMISIYRGYATATEAAALGVVIATIIAAVLGRPHPRVYLDAIFSTIKTSSGLLAITMAAYIFSYAIDATGATERLTRFVLGMDLSIYVFLAILFLMYAVLGCVIDSIGMIVLTVPLLVPILGHYDIDLIWFGVLLVVVVELGQITPPMGINLFVVDSIAKIGVSNVIRGVYPYYIIFVLFLILLTIFPQITLWPVPPSL